MASIEHEAKGSLEISALTSARLLQNEKNKKKLSMCSKHQRILLFNIHDYCTVLRKEQRSEVVQD
jgi:hypothetical protein